MIDGLTVASWWSVNSTRYVVDTGEPSCFACGFMCDEWKQLQRCHVVPASLGGSDEPSNLVMLCKDCHRDAPDTIYPEQFHKWVEARESCPFGWKYRWSAFEQCMATYGLTPEQCLDWVRKKLATKDYDHRLTTHYAEGIALSSMMALVAQDLGDAP